MAKKMEHIVLPDVDEGRRHDIIYTRFADKPPITDVDAIHLWEKKKDMVKNQIYVMRLPSGGVSFVQLVDRIDTRTEGVMQ